MRKNDANLMSVNELATQTFRYLYSERGIAYFEGGWWMLEADRMEFRGPFPRPMNRNEETKQITPDHTVYTFEPPRPEKKGHSIDVNGGCNLGCC